MNVFRSLLTALVVVSFFPIGTGVVIAQDDPIPTPAAEENQTHERIDEHTRLISAELSDGTATIVIESDIRQRITLSDAGTFKEGGVVRQRSEVISPGERVEISMPVTKVDGFAGVSIKSRETLYAVPLKSEVDFFDSESTWQTVQVAALGGASGVLVVAIILAWRLRDGGKSNVERVA
jgi:hypothetical protein